MMLNKELLLQQNDASSLYRITIGKLASIYGYSNNMGSLSPVLFNGLEIISCYDDERRCLLYTTPSVASYPVRITRMDTKRSIKKVYSS